MKETLVEAQGLRKVYQNGVPVEALRGVDLTIEKGAFVAVQGPSGSGKSTLLHLVGTLDRPTEGELRIAGQDVLALKGNALTDFRRKHIGFVFQMFYLIPEMTALENVMLPLKPYRRKLAFDLEARARELLEQVGLGHRMHHYPNQLSGGEQQRVAIARALVNRPTLLLADEPTGNLDAKTGEQIMHLLEILRQEYGLTILLVTHNDAIARYADRVLYLRDGKFVNEREEP